MQGFPPIKDFKFPENDPTRPSSVVLLGHWIHKIGFILHKGMDSRVEQLGISGLESILLRMVAAHKSISITSLAKLVGKQHTSILRQVDSLEEKGYITREPDATDRRVKWLTITEQGKKLIPEMNHLVETIEGCALEGFSEDERKKLMELLARIYNNLCNIPDISTASLVRDNKGDSQA